MHFAEVVFNGPMCSRGALARNRQLAGMEEFSAALDMEQLVAGLPEQPGDRSDVREFACGVGAVNLDVELRVLVLEQQLHSFQHVELETFDVELYEVWFRYTARI